MFSVILTNNHIYCNATKLTLVRKKRRQAFTLLLMKNISSKELN